MIKYGKIRLRVVNEYAQPFAKLCIHRHYNQLDDVAKEYLAAYRKALLDLGVERKVLDDCESLMKKWAVGIREVNEDELVERLDEIRASFVFAQAKKCKAEGADVVFAMSEEDEKLLEGKTDEEIRMIIEEIHGPQPDPKK